jgi:hypothetical protein
VTASEILAAARRLVEDHPPSLAGCWPRAVALLARQALETAVLDAFMVRGVDMTDVSNRAQLLCLGEYTDDDDLAADVRLAWWTLSRACHHHPYELAPTAGELLAWIATVDRLVTALAYEPVMSP